MSQGLNDYLNISGAYGSNLNSIQNFTNSKLGEAKSSFESKVSQLHTRGEALAGAALPAGILLKQGANLVKGAYSKYKGKNDADESGEGESSTADTTADTGADTGADVGTDVVADVGADTSSFIGPLTQATTEGGQDAADALFSNLPTSAPGSFLTGTTPAPPPAQPGATQPAATTADDDADIGTRVTAQTADDAPQASLTTANDVVDTPVTQTLSTTAETTGDEAAGGVLDGIIDTASVIGVGVAEAVPVFGGLFALGMGLYDIFHPQHESTPTAPISVASKGEMVLPSFDSVLDTPASQSAF